MRVYVVNRQPGGVKVMKEKSQFHPRVHSLNHFRIHFYCRDLQAHNPATSC